jgi:hypothetical protein
MREDNRLCRDHSKKQSNQQCEILASMILFIFETKDVFVNIAHCSGEVPRYTTLGQTCPLFQIKTDGSVKSYLTQTVTPISAWGASWNSKQNTCLPQNNENSNITGSAIFKLLKSWHPS